jgi:uncharacterized protein
MYVLVSPAKRLDMSAPPLPAQGSPAFIGQAEKLANRARQLSVEQLKGLMGISDKLAQLNYDRFQAFSPPFTEENSLPAVFMFAGDTYLGLDARSLEKEDLDFAQKHLGILSGLYGLLRPLDRMQPYRLEMGSKLSNSRGKDLYEFWGERIAAEINSRIAGHADPSIINLASQEYFRSVLSGGLSNVIVPQFKERRNGKLKIISFSAKRARGAMARFIVRNRLETPDAIKGFDLDGYSYQDELSDTKSWVFVR